MKLETMRHSHVAHGLLWAGLVTAVVAAPWMAGGYLFGTDWPGPRHIAFPTALSSSYLLQAGLALIGTIASGELATKILVLYCFLVGGFCAYIAIPVRGFLPKAIGATIYVLNPFVYDRLAYGQLFLLAGYAVLPLVSRAVFDLADRPSARQAGVTGLALALLGILDLHLLFPVSLLLVVFATLAAVRHRSDFAKVRHLAASIFWSLGVAVIASAYWLIPLLVGTSQEGQLLTGINQGQLEAFSTVPDVHFGLLANVLGLYGFWAEDTGRFTSLKEFAPFWLPVTVIFMSLSGLAIAWTLHAGWRKGATEPTAWIMGLAVAAVIAVILEIGVADPHFAPVIRWLDGVFPPYRGMRDAGKWAVLLALGYSQLVPRGLQIWSAALRRWFPEDTKYEVLQTTALGAALAVSIYYGSGLLFGAHGRIKPSAYPTGWYRVDQTLKDEHAGRVLFLPWHLYMSLSFVRNENNVVASPAAMFFSVPILTSHDPEVTEIPAPSDLDQRTIASLVDRGPTADWARVLASRGIGFVLLAREADWTAYAYLDNEPGLTRVADFGTLILYRNDWLK